MNPDEIDLLLYVYSGSFGVIAERAASTFDIIHINSIALRVTGILRSQSVRMSLSISGTERPFSFNCRCIGICIAMELIIITAIRTNDTIALQRGISKGRIQIKTKVKIASEKAGMTRKAMIRGLRA